MMTVHRTWLGRWGTLAALALAVALGRWTLTAAPSFTAVLEPDQVAAGDTAVLKLIFTDLGDPPAPVIPPLTNCVVNPGGVSRQFSFVNFSRTSSVVHQFALEPKSAGTVQIPSLTVEVDGKSYTSQPLTLRVGPGLDLSQIGTLQISVPRPEVYVGETFPLEIRFVFRNSPDQQAPPTITMDGFLKGRQKLENLPPETINGVVHGVARWTLAITAVKPGEFEIGPAELVTLYRFRDSRRVFGGFEQRRLTFSSKPISLRVLSPPATGRPPDYAGAVGRFQMQVTASPTNVTVGDPITVRVRVSGTGNFDGLRLPEIPANSGFQAYPGTNLFVEADPLGLTGVKNFEMVLVPEQAGVQQLRWPVLSAWDPDERRYVTDGTRPLQIVVRPGTGTQAQPAGSNVVAAPASPRPVTGVTAGDLPLKFDLGPRAIPDDAVVAHGWYWGLYSLPLATYAVVGLGLWWRRRRREDPDVARRSRARHAVREALANLGVQAREGRAAEFYASVNSALQGQLGLILGSAVGSYTEDVIDTRLVPRGLGPEDAARLRSLFADLALARFAPGADAGELIARQTEAESVLAALRLLEEAS